MLQKETDRLALSSENIKKVKKDINTELTEKGGTSANTISEVPGKLESMVKNNFKKVAIFYKELEYTMWGGSTTIPLNIPQNFNHFFVFLEHEYGGRKSVFTIVNTQYLNLNIASSKSFFVEPGRLFITPRIERLDNTTLKILVDEPRESKLRLKKIIAIE